MFEIKADNIICSLVDKFLDRKTTPIFNEDFTEVNAHGVILSVNCNISDYSDDMNINIYRNIWFLFTRHTTVFAAVDSMDDRWVCWNNIPLDAWKNTSNHDSCWRSDGMRPLNETYFDMCEEVNAARVKAGLKKIAPCSMSGYTTLGNTMVTEVRVTTKSDKDSHNPSYFRKLVSINNLPSPFQ